MTVPTFEIHPDRGVGPVEFGMTVGDAIRLMARVPGMRIDPSGAGLVRDRVCTYLPPQNAFQLIHEGGDVVIAIQLAGPTLDTQIQGLDPPLSAFFDGVDVFSTPGSELVELMPRHGDCEVRERGITYNFPSLGLCLWWGDRAWGQDADVAPFFEAVLVERAGHHLPQDTALGPAL